MEPCKPKDVISLPPFDFGTYGERIGHEPVLEASASDNQESDCKYECTRVDYLSAIQYGALDPGPIEGLGVDDMRADTTAVLQFYFETFDYERHTLTQESLLSFFCKEERSNIQVNL